MDRFWKTSLTGCLLAASAMAYAAGPVEVPIRYITAETAFSVVKDTPGLDSVTINVKNNSLSFSGSEEGIDAAKSFLALMDVPQAQVTLSARLVRYERDAAGKVSETVLQRPAITTATNRQASLDISGADAAYRLTFTPRVNRDGSVTIQSELASLDSKGVVRQTAHTVRRLRQNTWERLAGLTTSPDMLLRHAVEAGEVVTDRGPYTALYLDVTAQRVADGSAR